MIYTISDLHLSFASDKPMDVFGRAWDNHAEILERNWISLIRPEDTVVLPGDHSWGLRPEEALPDLAFIDALPGNKILFKGNHDLWWPTENKLKALCREHGFTTLHFISTGAVTVGDYVVCGTRGWLNPFDKDYSKKDESIYRREGLRLERAITEAENLAVSSGKILLFTHYPPFGRLGQPTAFTDIIDAHNIGRCFFGHLHGLRPGSFTSPASLRSRYILVSGDYVSFMPQEIEE